VPREKLTHRIALSSTHFRQTGLLAVPDPLRNCPGIPALVEHGKTLSGERFARAWAPATTAFYLHHGCLFPEATHGSLVGEPVMQGEQLVLL
jgi:hypothetical protein